MGCASCTAFTRGSCFSLSPRWRRIIFLVDDMLPFRDFYLQSLVKSLFAEAIFRIQKRTNPHQPPPTIVVYIVDTELFGVI
jgi:hypothetical protein